MFPGFVPLYLLVYLAPAIAALYCWRRSRHSGFAWIAAGYGGYVMYPNAIVYLVMPFATRPNPMVLMQSLLWFQILFPLLMIVGLRSLCASLPAKSRRQPDSPAQELQTPLDWRSLKKKCVGVIGVGLTLAGIATVVRGIHFIQQYNGELADLGVGPGAIVVGLMCIALAVHPRSPLNGVLR